MTWYSLYAALKDFSPDIIHAHGSKAAAIVNRIRPFVRMAATVVTVHGTKRRVKMYRGFDQTIAVSDFVGGLLGDLDYTVVRNGVSSETVAKESSPPIKEESSPVDGPLLLAVGRLAPVKGFDILLKAFVGLPGQLWIVGSGPEESRLKRLAQELAIEKRVRFLGWQADVPSLIAKADLVVISSRREGLPYILLESLMQRCPVVSTQVGGVPELLPEQYLVPTNNEAELAQRIQTSIENFDKVHHDYGPVFKRVREEFTLESMTDKISLVYRRALTIAAARTRTPWYRFSKSRI